MKEAAELIRFENVGKVYGTGAVRTEAVHDVSFSIDKGSITIVVGPSGAGKTTLLNMLGGMDTVTNGKIWVDGEDISHFSRKQLTEYRRSSVGFVFQF